MESEGSDIDELADLDLATFAQPGTDTSHPDESDDFKDRTLESPDWQNAKDTEYTNTGIHDQDAFFTVDSDFNFAPDSTQNSQKTGNGNPFKHETPVNSNPFHSGDSNTNPFSSAVSPFTSEMSSVEEISNPFLSGDTLIKDAPTVSGSTEYVYLNRLPGENLGMVLGIEGDQENTRPVDAVLVKSVTPGGAAARACAANNRILVGDEILEIDGQPLTELTHDECIAVFQDMPDNVVLTLRRDNADEGHISKPSGKKKGPPIPPPRKHFTNENSVSSNHPSGQPTESVLQSDGLHAVEASDNAEYNDILADHTGFDDLKVPKGFVKLDVTIFREEEDSLGLSIVPSYGATCDLYQIKRLLPTGACARSGLLSVGDRLLSCNGLSLKGLTQTQCQQVLKSSGNSVELTFLRHADDTITGTEDHTGENTDILGDVKQEWGFPDINAVSESHTQDSNQDQEKYTEKVNREPVLEFENFQIVEADGSVQFDYGNEYIFSSAQEDDDHLEFSQTNDGPVENLADEVKDETSSIHIPPPLEFSDTKVFEESESESSHKKATGQITNIDDLLFGELSDTGVSSETGNEKSENSVVKDVEQDCLLVSFEDFPAQDEVGINFNEPSTNFVESEFSGKSLEEFAEECFNRIGQEDGNFDTEKFSTEQKSTDSDLQEKEGVTPDTNNLVTRVPSTPADDSAKYVTTIPISAVKSDPPQGSAAETSAKAESRKPYTTNITVNSPPAVNVTKIDIVSATSVSNIQTSPPPVTTHKEEPGSVVFDTDTGAPPSAVTSTTIKVDGAFLQNRSMSDQSNNTVVHTADGVTTTGQLEYEEEDAVTKDPQGKPSDPASGGGVEPPKTDEDAKHELANVLSAVKGTPLGTLLSSAAQNGVDDEISDEAVATTTVSHTKKETVSGVLTSGGTTDTSEQPSGFQKTVSGVIDSKRIDLPANAMFHTTVGVSSKGQEDDIIQPMIVTKGHQGKPLYVPSSLPEKKNEKEVKRLDEASKKDIASILAILAESPQTVSLSKQVESEPSVAEEEIVPTVLSRDQKAAVLNVLQGWGSSEPPPKPSVFQKAVTGFIKLHKDENPKKETGDTKEKTGRDLTAEKDTDEYSTPVEKCGEIEEEVVKVSTSVDVESTPKKVLHVVSNFEKGANQSEQNETAVLRPKPTSSADVRGTVNVFEKVAVEMSQEPAADHVVMRPKSKQSTNFRAKIDSFQKPQESSLEPTFSVSVGSRRPKSMIEVSSSQTSTRFNDIRKAFTAESKPVPALRPLSSARPLSSSTNRLSTGSLGRPASGSFSSSTFSTRSSKADYPKSRQEDGSPFQVDVLKGIVSLGLKVKVTPEGHTRVTEIQRGGPIDKNGNVRVGDYVLSINSTELTGQTEARVQQVLRLLPRGLAKLVISKAAPGANSDQQAPEGSSYPQYSVRLSPKPFPVESHQKTPPSSSPSLPATDDGEEGFSSQDKDSSADLVLPIFTSAESTVSSSQAPLTVRIEISSGSQQGPGPVKIAIQPTPTPRVGHEVMRPKALPRHGYSSSANESWETSSEDSTPRELQGLRGQKIGDQEVVSPQKTQAVSGVTIGQGHSSAFQSNRGVFEQKAEVKTPPAVLPKPKTVPVPSAESVQNDSAAVPKVVSPPPSEKVDTEEAATEDTGEHPEEATTDDVETQPVKSPRQKVPPPVAPKPRLSSSSSVKSEGSNDADEQPVPAKPAPKISSGYERLQAITKASKPSKIIEKSRTFVSSTAKLFDNKGSEPETAPEKSTMTRRISVGVSEPEGSKTMNTSLMPMKERRKSTGTTMSSNPLPLSQPTSLTAASLSRPRTLSSTAIRPKEIVIPETSPRDHESPESKTKTVLSPTRLNAALSPRRRSSSDSPTSPPFIISPKKVPPAQEETPPKSFDGKNSSVQVEHTGIFKSSPITLHDNSSLSQSSQYNASITSPPPSDQSSQVITRDQRSKSFPSPYPPRPSSVSSQRSEEDLEHTMKKFDDLLMDAPYQHSETDPSDILLWAPIRKDSPLSTGVKAEVEKENTPVTNETNKPVAPPRRKFEVKKMELKKDEQHTQSEKSEIENVKYKNDVAEEKHIDDVQEKEEQTETKPELANEKPQDLKLQTVESFISYQQESKESENVIASKLSEQIVESQKRSDVGTEQIARQEPELARGDLHDGKSHTVESLMSNQQENEESENVVASKMSEQVKESEQINDVRKDQIGGNAPETVSEMLQDVESHSVETLMSLQQDNKERDNVVASKMSEQIIASQSQNVLKGDMTQDLTDSKLSNVPEQLEENKEIKNEILPVPHEEISKDLEDYAMLNASQASETVAMDSERQKTSSDNGLYESQASQIVNDVIAKIASDPTLLSQAQESGEIQGATEPLSPALSDDEPPPLPGAPPPPLILRNKEMLVSDRDLVDGSGSPVTPDSAPVQSTEEQIPKESTDELRQFVQPDAIDLQVNVDTGELFIMGKSDTSGGDHDSRADSIEPLNSTGDSFHEDDVHGANSPNPVDILSEDSGMPADEDQEMATDDAISPPGEFAETVSRSEQEKNVSLSPETALYVSSKQEEIVNHRVRAENDSNVAVESDSGIGADRASTVDIHSETQSHESVESASKESPSLLPATSPPCITEVNVAADHSTENLISQTSVSPAQVSASPALSREAFSPRSEGDTKEKSARDASDGQNSRASSESDDMSAENLEDGTDSDSVPNVAEQGDSQAGPSTVSSKRKWCLRSNKSSSPVLRGDSNLTVDIKYTEQTLVNSLPFSSFRILLDKTNAVLDAADAPDNMELLVLHLHRDGDSAPLGVDLKHMGKSHFQVSRIQADSPVGKSGVVEEGDWMVAVDNLWCDQVTLMRFLARLTKPKHDSLLVFATGGKTAETEAAPPSRPVSAPRPTSTQQQPSSQTMDKEIGEGEDTTTAQVEAPQEQQPDVTDVPSAAAPEDAPPLPDTAPPLPDQAPPLPDVAPPLPNDAPPLPSTAAPTPDQASSLLEQEETPAPKKVPPPVPEKRSKLPEKQSAEAVPAQDTSSIVKAVPVSVKQETENGVPEKTAPAVEEDPLVKAVPVSIEPVTENRLPAKAAKDANEDAPVKAVPVSVTPVTENGVAVKAVPITVEPVATKDAQVKAVPAEVVPVSTTKASRKAEPPAEATPVKEQPPSAESSSSDSASGPGILNVMMMKGATGVGFCLEGGIGSPKGNLPIAIKRIFKGGPAEKCGQLKVRDEILEVNGVDFTTMRHYEAWNHLKFLDDGEVHIKIRRK